MEDKKLVISQKKFSGDSSVLSLRIPNELVSRLDSIAESTKRTRNDIILKCLEYAVENIEIN
ncbi:MAG: ribbon-helix-helix domain-containing protein [Clostridiales bacterium]|nr:ribbon-helix-helix domain-containing protein [Clostridiales bacterium]